MFFRNVHHQLQANPKESSTSELFPPLYSRLPVGPTKWSNQYLTTHKEVKCNFNVPMHVGGVYHQLLNYYLPYSYSHLSELLSWPGNLVKRSYWVNRTVCAAAERVCAFRHNIIQSTYILSILLRYSVDGHAVQMDKKKNKIKLHSERTVYNVIPL